MVSAEEEECGGDPPAVASAPCVVSAKYNVFGNAELMHRIYMHLFPWYSLPVRLVCRGWEGLWSATAYPSLSGALKQEQLELGLRAEQIRKMKKIGHPYMPSDRHFIGALTSFYVGLAVRSPTVKDTKCMTAYTMIFDACQHPNNLSSDLYAQGRVILRRALVLVRHTTLLTLEAPRGSDEHWTRVAERFKQVTKKTILTFYAYLSRFFSTEGIPTFSQLVGLLLSEAKRREAVYLGAGGGDAGRAALRAFDIVAAAQAVQAAQTAQKEREELEGGPGLTWAEFEGHLEPDMDEEEVLTLIEKIKREKRNAARFKERETDMAAQAAAELVELGFAAEYA